jgi:endonuclease YncB( thermonuclease family)
MRYIILLPLLLLFQHNYLVIDIPNGDTIKILQSNQQVTIRLNGIECPESTQPFGQKAKEFTTAACFQKEVRLITYGTDNNGRTIADVYLSDGKILNQELLRNGLAWHDKEQSSDTTLARLEMEARDKKSGLWADSIWVEPWVYRNLTKVKKNSRIDSGSDCLECSNEDLPVGETCFDLLSRKPEVFLYHLDSLDHEEIMSTAYYLSNFCFCTSGKSFIYLEKTLIEKKGLIRNQDKCDQLIKLTEYRLKKCYK